MALVFLLVGALGGYVYAQWQAQWWFVDRWQRIVQWLAYSSSAWPQGFVGGQHEGAWSVFPVAAMVGAVCAKALGFPLLSSQLQWCFKSVGQNSQQRWITCPPVPTRGGQCSRRCYLCFQRICMYSAGHPSVGPGSHVCMACYEDVPSPDELRPRLQ